MSDSESLHNCDKISAVIYEFQQVLFPLINKFEIQIDLCFKYILIFNLEENKKKTL